MTRLVSAIVPVFDQEAYVEAAVRSLLLQSWAELEVICVDDGSRDRSADILEGVRDPRLRVLRQENLGPSAALNTGLLAARGDIVFVMGGDDLSEPQRFERQIEHLDGAESDFVFCLPALIDSDGEPLHDAACLPLFSGPTNMTAAARYRRFFDEGNHLCAPTMCASRSALDRVGRFHPGLVQLQDWDYWVRALAIGCRIDVSDERLVRYRRHGNSLSHRDRDHVVAREAFHVWGGFFDSVSGTLLREAFADTLDPAPAGTAMRRDDIPFCYLAHRDEAVRRLGFLRLIDAREKARSGEPQLDYAMFRDILSVR